MNTLKQSDSHGVHTIHIVIMAFISTCAFSGTISTTALPSPVSAAVSTQYSTPNLSQSNSNTVNMPALLAANQSNIVVVKDLAALHRMFPGLASNNTRNLPLPTLRAGGFRAASTCIKKWNVLIDHDNNRIPKVLKSAVCSSKSPCAFKCVPVRAVKVVHVIKFQGFLNGQQVWQWKSRDFHYNKNCKCQ